MASAIALHNLPEGMTIGASFANSDATLANSVLALSILNFTLFENKQYQL